jgi:hypothetical protein
MRFSTVSRREYELQRKNYASVFDTPAFAELNKRKCDQLVYGFFSDSKLRLGLAAGITNGWLKAPFSAPYACFSWISSAPRVADFQDAVAALLEWAREKSLAGISITLPPSIYGEDVVSKTAVAFFNAGFALQTVDLNFAYDLASHDERYAEVIDIKARQKLRGSQKEDFRMCIAASGADFAEAYEIIRRNREHRGFPLKLTLKDLIKTAEVISSKAFILRGAAGTGVAAAICFLTQPQIAQVIYWGNLPETAQTSPMNNLAWQLFNFYKREGMRFVDTGTSTDEGIPNLGLSDFKQSIGCATSNKLTFNLSLA